MFFIFERGSATPPQQEKALLFYSEGVRSKIGISGEDIDANLGSDPLQIKKSVLFLLGGGVADPLPKIKSLAFLFVRKNVWAGPARASRPVPGLVPLKYFPPWRPRQRPTWLKRSNLACGGCDSSRLEGGVWGGEAPPGKKI